jgi:hypothetical protein
LLEVSGREWTFDVPVEKPLGELLRELHVSSDQVQDVQVSQGRLEDVFRKLTTEQVTI